MRITIASFLVGTIVSQVGWAAEEPRGILEKAIKAHGGEEAISKTVTGAVKGMIKGNLPPGVEFEVKWEETFELPRKLKRKIEGQAEGMAFTIEYGVVDRKGWMRQNNGEVRDIEVPELSLDRHWNAMLAILPRLLNAGFKLSSAAKRKVDGRDTLGITVEGPEGTGEFYFDATNGLLVKAKRRVQDPFLNKEVDGEVQYADFKEISGVTYPMRITTYVDGKKTFEVKLSSFKLLERIDPAVFAKPQ